MPKSLHCLLACYRTLLWLYPPDLRHEYGNEMLDVFSQILSVEWTRRGKLGVAAAGCRALGEVFTVAIPGHLSSDWLIVACLSLMINSGVLGLLVAVMMFRRSR
jgi:hypothetical protein